MPAPYTVAEYVQALRAIHRTGSATAETSFYTPLDRLFNAVGETLKPKVLFFTQLRTQGARLPDGGFFPRHRTSARNNAPQPLTNPERGAVEIKPAGYSLDILTQSDQTRRYLQQYGLVLLTNLHEFAKLAFQPVPLRKPTANKVCFTIVQMTGSQVNLNSATPYPEMVGDILRPSSHRAELILDLFAGCGGLGLGFEAAGFRTVGFEMNRDCCSTYNKNLGGMCAETFLTATTEFPDADVVIGGPPCQPFSVGGHQRGLEDSRDGFPAFAAAVAQLRPKIWMFENVRGLLYKNRWYLDQITQTLERLGYIVEVRLLNASHFLVPQSRERLIVVGHRGGYRFPERSSRVVTVADALGESLFSEPSHGRYLTASMDRYVAKYEKASKCINPRDLNPNRPSRTVTCRNLGGATGDMQRIKLPSGRRRRLSVREGARLQSFPDWFDFHGTETSQFDQIGNAVPPMFALALAQSVATYLDGPSPLAPEAVRECWTPTQVSLTFPPEFSFGKTK